MSIGQRIAMALLVAISQITVLGCGSKDFDKTLYPIEGEVYFKGKPAVGCIVSFHPKVATGEGAGAPCLGTADSNGKFRVTTREPFDGIAAGEYEVSFSLPGEGTSRDPNGDAAPDKLPTKYQFPGSSGFKVTITSSTSTLDRFDLK